MTDHIYPTSHAQALANIIIAFAETPDKFGTLCELHRTRIVALAESIREEDKRMLDKLSFADRYEYPAMLGHSEAEARDRLR